jgi:hypothetical protein
MEAISYKPCLVCGSEYEMMNGGKNIAVVLNCLNKTRTCSIDDADRLKKSLEKLAFEVVLIHETDKTSIFTNLGSSEFNKFLCFILLYKLNIF